MMGKDVERILSGINAVKDAATSCISSLANATAYRLTHEANHGGLSTAPCYPIEKSKPAGAAGFVSPIRAAMSGIATDQANMSSLASDLYTSSETFNNGYGSPWTEMNKLEEAIATAEAFAGAHANLDWLGEKAGLLGLLNAVLSAAVDAKWALTVYHDYIQRGYDNKFNGNVPSITFTSGIQKETIGNVSHDYNENVHIEQPSIDPF